MKDKPKVEIIRDVSPNKLDEIEQNFIHVGAVVSATIQRDGNYTVVGTFPDNAEASKTYSGYWTGEMRGTNVGSFILDLKHEGQMVQGKAKFHEPTLGMYEYLVKGVAGPELSLDLTPTANPSNLRLGRIKATAHLQEKNQLVGKWKSEIGTEGTFSARRESSGLSQKINQTTQAATGKDEPNRFPRALADEQRDELHRAYRRMIEVIVNSLRGDKGEPEQFIAFHNILAKYTWAHLPIPQWFYTCVRLPLAVEYLRAQVGADDLRGAYAFINQEFLDFRKIVEPPSAFTRTDNESSTQTSIVPLFDPTTALSETLPEIANDGLEGEPHIDISADVQSIARVMCMQQVKPPLSIALFGNWGSGKSFFMRQLRNEVGKIKESPDAGTNNKPFYQDIIQIEFNAWHYVEANLWASLVSHIFENLKSSTGEPSPDWEAKRDELLARLGTVKQARNKAEQELAKAKEKESAAQRNLIIKQNEAQNKELALQGITATDILKQTLVPPGVTKELRQVQEILGLSNALDSADDVARSIHEAQRFGKEAVAFVRAFWTAPGFGLRVLFVFCAILSPFLIPMLMGLATHLAKTPEWSAAAKIVTTLVASVAALLQPILRTKANAETALASLKKANNNFDAEVQKKVNARNAELETAKLVRSQATAAVAEAENAVAEANQSVKNAKRVLEEASPRRILNAFIEERSASDDYRKSLGILALVRRDFEKLSNLMAAARNYRAGKLPLNKKLTPDEIKLHESLPRVDRIILYIDDLDRCPPKQVVEVLQAIHLLLAFELFVVVVGVDPRWISRSLKMHYPELLGNDPDIVAEQLQSNGKNKPSNNGSNSSSHDLARPLDYLEKIFQIPFWIKPIGGPETSTLIKGLLTPADTSSPAKSERQEAENKLALDIQESAAQMDQITNAAQKTNATAKGSEDDAGPASTTLSEAEVEFMIDLKRLAGATPRAVKRFVNIYRLLRARVSKNRVNEFVGKVGEPREFEAVMYLLALFNTVPLFAQRFCNELEKQKASELYKTPKTERLNTPLAEVIESIRSMQLRRHGGFSETESGIFDAIQHYLAKFEASVPKPTIDSFCRWHPVVSRYSFIGESLIKFEAEPALSKS